VMTLVQSQKVEPMLKSGLCTQAQLESPAFQAWVYQVHETPGHLHRKVWEYCFIAQALHERGKLKPGSYGIGFAVGQEPMPALFASYGCRILATDLATEQAAQSGWVDTNQHAASLDVLNQRGICPPDAFREQVDFQFVDMRSLPAGLGPADFVWSTCAFEHLGSLEAGLRFVRESLDCLGPDGVAVHTTEYNVFSNDDTLSEGGVVLYRRRDLEELGRQLNADGYEVFLTFDTGDSVADHTIDRPPYTHEVHLKLEFGGYVTTTFGLIVQKTARSRPYGIGRDRRPDDSYRFAPADAQQAIRELHPARSQPAAPPLISGICTQAQLESATFQRWAVRLREPHMRLHRKLWEWCFITQALYERGMLASGRHGLAFAVGHEPLPAFFANQGATVVATDLFEEQAQQSGWVETNQHARELADLNARGLCDPDLFRERVSFRYVDMNYIPGDLGNFDFLWSSCSLEHLGSIQHGIAFILNAMHCLKPGGIAVHTTEFNLSSNDTTIDSGSVVLFRRRDIDRIVEELRAAGHRIDIDYSQGNGFADNFVDLPPYKQEVHLRLQIQQYVVTSIGLIIQKQGGELAGTPAQKGRFASYLDRLRGRR
jgi:SAM-dependent methyltransferase